MRNQSLFSILRFLLLFLFFQLIDMCCINVQSDSNNNLENRVGTARMNIDSLPYKKKAIRIRFLEYNMHEVLEKIPQAGYILSR